MDRSNQLEIQGTLERYPLAELIVEFGQAELNGSLRLGRDAQKAILYFRDGDLVYAVSNARQHRLLSLLIEQKRLDRASAQRCPAPANDVELAAWMISEGLMSREAIDETIITQMENIIIEVLTWGEGEWLFSPLARIRPDMSYRIDIHKVLINYARCIPLGGLNERFRSVNEVFRRTGGDILHLHLQNNEEAILREFDDLPLTIEELREKNPMPEQGLLQGLYILWLGGILERREWSMAISPSRLADIRNARITLARQAATLPAAEPPKPDETPQAPADRSRTAVTAISMEEYLTRAEGGVDHYELLGLTKDAEPAAIKAAYFGLAKLFHPDRFHREDAETQRRKPPYRWRSI